MPIPSDFAPYDPQGPFLEHIGPIQVRQDTPSAEAAAGARDLVLGLLAEERHANQRGTVMGGVLATFAAFALGRAIEADADDDKDRATVSLTTDFLKPAKPGDWIEARCSVDRVGGTLSFAECTLSVEGEPVARARSVWAAAG